MYLFSVVLLLIFDYLLLKYMIVLASKFVLFPFTTKGFYKVNQFNINKTGQLKNNVFIIKCIHLTEKNPPLL